VQLSQRLRRFCVRMRRIWFEWRLSMGYVPECSRLFGRSKPNNAYTTPGGPDVQLLLPLPPGALYTITATHSTSKCPIRKLNDG